MSPEIFYSIVGNNISHFRQEKGITQEELAHAISLNRTSVSNIEQGRQKILLHNIYEIANFLEVTPFDLLPQKNVIENMKKSNFSIPDDISANEKIWVNELIMKNNKNEQ